MPEPVVMIPGLMCDARLFWHQIVALSRTHPVSVVLPHPGTTIEDLSAHVLAMSPARFALVGLGLGAQVALDVLRREPARVARIVLISADPLGDTPQTAEAREKRIILARTSRLLRAMTEELPDHAIAYGDLRREVLDLSEDMALALGEDVYVDQSRALQRRRDQQKTLRMAKLPALILAGAADSLVPVRRQALMADLMPTARLQVIEDAGHLLPLEQPQAVTAALGLFLKGPLVLG